VLGAATAMQLNPRKSVVIPLGKQTAFSIHRHINENIPALIGLLVQWHGKYLGFMVGPTAELARWVAAAAKFWQRGMAARDAGGGFFHNVLSYSIYSTSVLGYLMQLSRIPRDILRMEARLLQYFTHGPWNATPSSCLLALRDLGFPKEPASLAEANSAAMLRAAAASSAFPAAIAPAALHPTDPDALLAPRLLPWIDTTAIMQMKANSDSFRGRFPGFLLSPHDTLQHRARCCLRDSRPSPWDELLRRRALRWFPDCAPHAVEHIHCNIVAACKILPPRVVFSTIRLINNGVATSRRFQEQPLNCHLCGWIEGDCIEHYIHCEELLIFVTRHLPNIGWRFGPVHGTLRSMLSIELPTAELVATVVSNDLLVTALATITQGSVIASPEQHFSARLRALSRSSATIRNSLFRDEGAFPLTAN
jgi:hypothetical protein